VNLVLFGPPGAGKGTQSWMICERYKLLHLSTGDQIRAAIRAQTPFGLEIKERVEHGELIPDAMVTDLVRTVVRENRQDTDSFLFDGYPRTVEQVGDLDGICEEFTLTPPAIVNLAVPNEVLMLRLTGRRLCAECKRGFNVYLDPSRRPGVCDHCGGPLMHRVDDSAETVRERLKVYEAQTRRVLDVYEQRGALHEVDGTGTTQEVFGRICRILAETY
jgi:adenylate kinase